MTDISPQTLRIVAKELNATLTEARAALEFHAEHQDQPGSLEKCADRLHLAYGVLRLVEVHGGALLAQEMEHVARHLPAAGGDQRRRAEDLDALMRAMVQLSAYVERALSGGRDLPLVLLPLLNDLRSVRGGPLLSEGTLLLLDLKSDQPARPRSADGGEPIAVEQWARRLRQRFQAGLLGFIRGEDTVRSLEILSEVAERLEQAATLQAVFQLWWVTGAVLEALRSNGLESSPTLKRLLGQADRQIKLLYEVGELRYCENPPVELLNNLLYYVACATSGGERVAAVRASFKLSALLPVGDSIEQQRESLSAPSVKLMRTVAAAIKEDLSRVKGVFDVFVRQGGGRPDELLPQLELLKKISDTLGVLGLGELRQSVQQEISDLSEIVSDGRTPSEPALNKVAAVLLSVEDSLDDQLLRLILPAAPALAAGLPDQDIEFRLVSEAVLRECIVNLARIKDAVSVAVVEPSQFPPQGLDSVPHLLRGITAGLLMLGKTRAVELMEAVGVHVQKLVEPGAALPATQRLQMIADAVVNIEFYMETLQNGRSDPWYMLDNAEMCVKALADDAPAPAPLVEAPVAPSAAVASAAASAPFPSSAPVAAATGAGAGAGAEEFDADITGIYSDEAQELLEAAETSLKSWNDDRSDQNRVAELQRHLHTLKGGARMAGIGSMGELSHELESLVIQIAGGSVAGDDHAYALLQSSLDELARMRDRVREGSVPPAASVLLEQIRNLSRGVPMAAPTPAAVEEPPGPGREIATVERIEMARVDADVLDTLLNNAGEVSILRTRVEQQVNSVDFNLAELARTVVRLKEQLRGLDAEAEPFSRSLAETSADVSSIQGLLEALTREAQNLLTQQGRLITELQNGLMRTRMVPFQRHVPRLMRLVRQAAHDTGKRAELSVLDAAEELDRQLLERMVPPLEHLLRNAVVHGIEAPERRASLGKPDIGRISVSLERDGAEVVIVVADDGGGINVGLIREKAAALGLVDSRAKLTDEEAIQLILEPGFSTVESVTQAAGRGVGMDVVATEVKKLGGGLSIESDPGRGSRFTIRLPLTLAISQALIVRVGEEVYALPLSTVAGVARLPRNIVARHFGKDAPPFDYGGQNYRFAQLGAFVGSGATRLPETDGSMSVVLVRAGENSTALVMDELVGSREIVVQSLGPQISGIRGIAGATILGDGRIVVILDMGSLVRSEWRARPQDLRELESRDTRAFALVVDDSITVRRVTQRLLERKGMRVLAAKDGMDAILLLQNHVPDIILLDIEMPRMDGFEVAAHVRNDPRLKDIPIVMITSRVSETHRARALALGVDDYLGKPYRESQLLDAIEPLLNRRHAVTP